jgi:hypothetical protein
VAVRILTTRDLRSLEELARRLENRGLVAESQTLQDILRGSADHREVRASVAAEILHVTPQTVRNWVKRGLLGGRIDETGHVFVEADALQPAVEMDAALPYLPDSAADYTIEQINAEIAALRGGRDGR